MTGTAYDRIGRTYTTTRREDPRIRAAIHAALGDARTVLNVGAGAGAYEPRDREVLAVEPSEVMIAQRPPGAAPVVRATAEALALPDASFDAAMAVLTIHHWPDPARGLAELRRIARRVVVLTWDQRVTKDFWLPREYLPEITAIDDERDIPIDRVATLLGGAEVTPVLVPHDCADGFLGAYWRRPEAYLDPLVRAGISPLAMLGEHADAGLARLEEDLRTGAWQRRHADLLERDELDLGYRLIYCRP
jgi:SAM-dependent methyltransferase